MIKREMYNFGSVIKILLIMQIFSLFVIGPNVFAKQRSVPFITKSKHFSVYGKKNVDLMVLIDKLNFNDSSKVKELKANNNPSDGLLKETLAHILDDLYVEITKVLDMQLYQLHVNIEILPDSASVKSLYKNYVGVHFTERSFYAHDGTTVYISNEDLTVGMLGHEIGHAIISHYFVVPPTAKVQEILTGYIEYALRKKEGTLP